MLPETSRRVDELVAEAQSKGRAPAVVAGVVRDGGLVHFAAAADGPPPGPDVQFRIGSISKTLTAVLALQLRDEGALSLEDPLSRHVAGTPVGGVTIRQLLAHVAGLQREPEGDWWERCAGTDIETMIKQLTPDKLAHPPHRTFHYSNLAYGLLGAVLTASTGTSWLDLVTERLLAPLEMTRTTYQATEPFARGYVVHPAHGALREEPRHDAGAMAPAGQLWSTTADLATWAAFLADPAPDLLAPGTAAELRAPAVIADPDAWTAGHGLGVQLWRDGERVYVGHSGSMPGYLAILMTHHPSRTGVVAYANAYTLRGNGSIVGLGRRLLTAVLDSEPAARPKPWRPGTPPPPEVAPLCGRWWWMGREYEVGWDTQAPELLMTPLTNPGAKPWRFTPEGPDRWRGRSGENDGEILAVRRDPHGTPVALDIATFIFHRSPDEEP
ncbi:serine hydrolase domain-containing protein [Rhizomonospora bruguierae]|uniref:serine hydrolase domain-containing protein n=1 Tax=Rhizomonospora bruguierae TaxID=1581705 RepID=UPI0020C10C8D|nr:serine hydrolase domain-containing protein [Micromonospora sp. NBRC 107566]